MPNRCCLLLQSPRTITCLPVVAPILVEDGAMFREAAQTKSSSYPKGWWEAAHQMLSLRRKRSTNQIRSLSPPALIWSALSVSSLRSSNFHTSICKIQKTGYRKVSLLEAKLLSEIGSCEFAPCPPYADPVISLCQGCMTKMDDCKRSTPSQIPMCGSLCTLRYSSRLACN